MSSYKIQKAASGDLTLIFSDAPEIKLHSAYDPLKEAERAVSNFNKGRASIIIVSGLALGYHINFLKSKYPDNQIIILEHDHEVIELARINTPGNLDGAFIINSMKEAYSFFEELDLKTFKGAAHYTHRPSYNLYRNFYDSNLMEIKQLISSKISDMLTRIEFETNWVKNIFSNLHHLFTSAHIIEFFGKFQGYPGIIVSAGPSLKKNVEFLNRIRDRALIVGVDTAVKVMEKKRVVPHIIMTLDSQKHSIKHFLGLKNQSPLLLADIVSCPDILRSYRGEKAVSTTSKYFINSRGENCKETTPAMNWIEKYSEPIGDIQSGGSVATSAFDLLLNLGCDPIILLGQDLAYTGREIHSTGTHHNDDWVIELTRFMNLDTINQRVIRKRKIKYLNAYGGKGKVISDFVLDLYRGWFSDSAKKVKVSVINATEGGAEIENTVEKSLISLINNLMGKDISPQEIIDSITTNKKKHDMMELMNAVTTAHGVITDIDSITENHHNLNILEKIEHSGLTELFNPFLRKTDMYIARYNIDQEKAVKVYNTDILTGCKKLRPILEKCISLMKGTVY